jgi:hypothetical protein
MAICGTARAYLIARHRSAATAFRSELLDVRCRTRWWQASIRVIEMLAEVEPTRQRVEQLAETIMQRLNDQRRCLSNATYGRRRRMNDDRR